MPNYLTSVDFGDVHVNETRVKTISVLNGGKYPIELEWHTNRHRLLTIKPEKASVQKGEKVTDLYVCICVDLVPENIMGRMYNCVFFCIHATIEEKRHKTTEHIITQNAGGYPPRIPSAG